MFSFSIAVELTCYFLLVGGLMWAFSNYCDNVHQKQKKAKAAGRRSRS